MNATRKKLDPDKAQCGFVYVMGRTVMVYIGSKQKMLVGRGNGRNAGPRTIHMYARTDNYGSVWKLCTATRAATLRASYTKVIRDRVEQDAFLRGMGNGSYERLKGVARAL